MNDKAFHARRRSLRPRKLFDKGFLPWRPKDLRNMFSGICVVVVVIYFIVLPASRFLLRWIVPSWSVKVPATDKTNAGKIRCQSLEFVQQTLTQNNNTITDIGSQTHFLPLGSIPIDDSSLSLYRRPDIADAFASYLYRHHPKCSISSLDLHLPFSPLCPDRSSFLRAFSSGGRIGFDTPYIPQGCDMRWFTTSETCEVLSRFEKVIFIGDSMMRHIVGAMNVVLRQDLGYGAVTGWNFGDEELEKCFCTHQMDVKACSVQGVYRTEDVLKHDPDSFACEKWTREVKDEAGKTMIETVSPINLIIELMLKFPLDPVELQRLQELLPPERPKRPIAFIFGHGLWNDLDLQATVNWLMGILNTIYTAAPYLSPENLPREQAAADLKNMDRTHPLAHILFTTPSAAGILKPDQWIQSQGNKALQVFEQSVHDLIHWEDGMFFGKGIEHMGTWNMSIQMHKWDGVHLSLKGNLIKAMGVINWLSGVKVEIW